MWSHARAAPFIESAVGFDRFHLLFACERNAVQGCHFVERPILRPFHARAVVTEDVNNESVVGEAHLRNGLDNAAHSVIGVFLVTGINFHLTRIHFLYFRRDARPRGERRITRSKFGVGWNNTELLLSCEGFFAQFVPALIELALVFVAPFLRHLMWRMCCTRREIEKERFVRSLRFLIAHPRNRMVCHCIVEIEVFLVRDANDLIIFNENRIELTGFSAEKSPEIVEAKRVRPAVKRARRPLLRVGCEMPFSNCSSVVTVRLENLRDGSRARWPVRAVAGPTTDQFRDGAESHRVMVSPRQQGSARRRTKRRHVKPIVAESLRREFVERRRSDRSDEGRRIAEASIIN